MITIERFKERLEHMDEENSVKELKKIIDEKPKNIKKTLLMSNSLKEPLSLDWTEEKNEFLNKVILKVVGETIKKRDSKNPEDLKDIRDLFEITNAINTISKSTKENEKLLAENSFNSHCFLQKVSSIMSYFESQRYYMAKDEAKEVGKEKFITGMEGEVAKYKVEEFGTKMHNRGQLEGLIETIGTLLDYLNFIHSKSLEKEFKSDFDFISPYENSSLEELMILANHRHYLNYTWENFKYEDWSYQVKEEIGVFFPKDSNRKMAEEIATQRQTYRHVSAMNSLFKNRTYEMNKFVKKLNNYIKQYSLGEFNELLKLKKETYSELKLNQSLNLEIAKRIIAPTYLPIKISEISIEEYMLGYEYISTLAYLYNSIISRTSYIDDKIHQLVPLVLVEDLVNHFSELYELPKEKSKKILELYIFKKKIHLDLFSQPLINVGKETVLFSSSLILQLNIPRMVEMFINEKGIDVSIKGIEFEEEIRKGLNINKNLQVNRKPLEFDAYDGKKIEFDFLGTFKDHLLLIEFKHMKNPYTGKERYNSFETIKDASKQIKRRIESIEKDWDTIKSLVDIELPKDSYSKDKIIKLICTNVYSFTKLMVDDIPIIDSQSLISYFSKSGTEIYSTDNSIYAYFRIWEKEEPTVKEFLNYIKNPLTTELFKKEYFKNQYRPLRMFEGEDDNRCYELILEVDPYREYIKNKIERTVKSLKIGRNEPCPCGSEKKYKKCCGKN